MTTTRSTLESVAQLVGGMVHHAGGNILNVRVVPVNRPWCSYDFGMEPGDVVGWDCCIDGEYFDSGELRVDAEAAPEVIAAEILSLLELGQDAYDAKGAGR